MVEYLHPCIPELKIRDYDTYKAVCCGICGQLREEYGFWASCFFGRDTALLALLSDGLAGREGTGCQAFCIKHPLHKRNMMCHTQGIRLAARLNVILAWHHLQDRLNRPGCPLGQRLKDRLLCRLLSTAFHRAAANGAQIERLLRQERDHAAALTLSKYSGYDAACEPAENFFGALFVYCAPDPSAAKALRRAGAALGRIVYLLGAVETFERDRRYGMYNVFDQNGLSYAAAQENAKYQCNLAAAELAGAYNLLNLKLYRSLVDNMIFMGLETAVAHAGNNGARRWKEP